MAGLAPASANEVNNSVGQLLRSFIDMRSRIHRYQTTLAGLDLTLPPFNMTPAEQTDIKSAINGVDTALQALDLTFANRLVGFF